MTEMTAMTPHTRHVPPERLSEWVSGDLNERDTAIVRAHVTGCAGCADVVAELRAQGAALRTLDRPEPPPTLWPTIEGAIDADAGAGRGWSWPAWLWGALAGATAAGIVAWGFALTPPRRGTRADENGTPRNIDAQVLARLATGPGADPLLIEAERELGRAASSYAQAASRLRVILEHEQALWDPASRARVAERLAGLDEAIVHARAVAERDPGDGAGAEMLFSAYRRQIDFLAEVVHRGSPGAEGRADRGRAEALP
jgi:hypothetical protein